LSSAAAVVAAEEVEDDEEDKDQKLLGVVEAEAAAAGSDRGRTRRRHTGQHGALALPAAKRAAISRLEREGDDRDDGMPECDRRCIDGDAEEDDDNDLVTSDDAASLSEDEADEVTVSDGVR
jgi:hypothetical protein